MPRSASFLLATMLLAAPALAQEPPRAGVPPTPQPTVLPASPAQPTLETLLAQMVARPSGLTAEEVGRRAEETSFDARARQKEIEAAAAQVDQAIVGYFPRLTLTGRYTRYSPVDQPSISAGSLVGTLAPAGIVPPGSPLFSTGPLTFPIPLDNYYLQANLGVPLTDYFFRTTQTHAAATHSEKGAKWNEIAARLKARTDGKATYWTWVRAKLSVIVAEQALAQAIAHRKDAESAFQVGTASHADVLRVESQVASNELLVARAKNLSDLLERQVRVAMHDAGAAAYEIGDDVRTDVPTPADVASVDRLMAEALDKRAEVRALDETAYSLKESAKAARATYAPIVTAFGDVIYANPNPRIFPQTAEFKATWDVGLQLVWSPNDVAVGAAAGRTYDARAAQTEAQRSALLDALRVEVTQAWQALREAELAVDTTGRGLRAAEESYRVRRELFAHGRATSVELTDAEVELTRARLELVNARVDLRIAVVRLLHATGRDVVRAP